MQMYGSFPVCPVAINDLSGCKLKLQKQMFSESASVQIFSVYLPTKQCLFICQIIQMSKKTWQYTSYVVDFTRFMICKF